MSTLLFVQQQTVVEFDCACSSRAVSENLLLIIYYLEMYSVPINPIKRRRRRKELKTNGIIYKL